MKKAEATAQSLEAVSANGEIVTTELQTTPVEVDFEKIEATLAQIDTMKRGISQTPRYMEFSIGEKTRGVFLGFKILLKKEADGLKQITCVVWADKDKNVWCNGGVSFVSGFITQNPDGSILEMTKGKAFEAELIELKPSGTGKVKVFSIYNLS